MIRGPQDLCSRQRDPIVQRPGDKKEQVFKKKEEKKWKISCSLTEGKITGRDKPRSGRSDKTVNKIIGWVFSAESWGQLEAQGGAESQNWDLWSGFEVIRAGSYPGLLGVAANIREVDSGWEGSAGRSRGSGLSCRVGWYSPSLGGLQLEMKSFELLLPFGTSSWQKLGAIWEEKIFRGLHK